MLARIAEPKRRYRDFLTYDLEWYPENMKLRMVGVYDGKRYRYYLTVNDFLEHELTTRNAGKWFYAHAGGLYDIQFILEYLAKNPAYEVSAAFSGSSAIIVRVKRGRYTWTFLDSLWTLRASLAEIGKLIGMLKGSVAWDAPLNVLADYNEQDCKILWHALDQFQDLIIDLGSELKPTLASTALRLFQRRFLSEDIPTNPTVDERISTAYVGGRVEVFNHQKGVSGKLFDINSSYPAAMLKPMPGKYIGARLTIPENELIEYIACVDIYIPESDVPVVPVIARGSLFFPTGIIQRRWLARPEIELALKTGCKILQVHECACYTQNNDLAVFSQHIYDLRIKSNGFMKIVYKLIGNSVYGKFGENTLKAQVLINPSKRALMEAKKIAKYENGFLSMITPGIFLIERVAKIPHGHKAFAAYTTSYARVRLAEFLLEGRDCAVKSGSDFCSSVFYTDTDSIATNQNLATSDELGGLKLETSFDWAHFHAPKLYARQLGPMTEKEAKKGKITLNDGRYIIPEQNKNGRWTVGENVVDSPQTMFNFGEWQIKAKGFRGLTPKEFVYLRDHHGEVQTERVLRIRELYSKGLLAPTSKTQPKHLLNIALTKRRVLNNGKTVPWNIDELKESESPDFEQL